MDRIPQQTCFFLSYTVFQQHPSKLLSPQMPSHAFMSDNRPSKTHLQFHVKSTPLWWAVLYFDWKKTKKLHIESGFLILDFTLGAQMRCTTKSYTVWLCPAWGGEGHPWARRHENSSPPGWIPELTVQGIGTPSWRPSQNRAGPHWSTLPAGRDTHPTAERALVVCVWGWWVFSNFFHYYF